MQTHNFPIHMKLSYMLAIYSFAKDGFYYGQNIIAEKDDSFTIEIDASEQQIMDLGIKIGYRLNGAAAEIERQYEKWKELCDNSRNEFDQRKMDRAFDKLCKMFPTEEMFKEYWKTKCSMKLRVNITQ
jgi:hypothetical protein